MTPTTTLSAPAAPDTRDDLTGSDRSQRGRAGLAGLIHTLGVVVAGAVLLVGIVLSCTSPGHPSTGSAQAPTTRPDRAASLQAAASTAGSVGVRAATSSVQPEWAAAPLRSVRRPASGQTARPAPATPTASPPRPRAGWDGGTVSRARLPLDAGDTPGAVPPARGRLPARRRRRVVRRGICRAA